MGMQFVWVQGLRGPEPTRCDSETIAVLKKHFTILKSYPLPEKYWTFDLVDIIPHFPAPEASDASNG